jgi:hypothetical protein
VASRGTCAALFENNKLFNGKQVPAIYTHTLTHTHTHTHTHAHTHTCIYMFCI